MKSPSLTLGVEEEYQVVDPETRELRPFFREVPGSHGEELGEQVKPELHQCVVEVGSRVCSTPAEIRDELIRLRRAVLERVAAEGLTIAAAGTHPFSSWMEQEITPLERYRGLMEDLQQVAQKNLIFGLHVHVGIEDREFLIDAMNVARYFLPHLLALSASSPFWMGRRTGLKSYRSVVWSGFPRTGIPRRFGSWDEYRSLVEVLVAANSIEDGTKIWWDLRPNWNHETLEFRICDQPSRIDEVVCLAALFQAIVARLWELRGRNLTFRQYPAQLIEENKWRAARYGVRGEIVDFGKGREVAVGELIEELLGWFLGDVLDELGSRKEAAYARRLLEEGSSADRQLAAYEERGETVDVVDLVLAESRHGLE